MTMYISLRGIEIQKFNTPSVLYLMTLLLYMNVFHLLNFSVLGRRFHDYFNTVSLYFLTL